jgi:hypothetical protein
MTSTPTAQSAAPPGPNQPEAQRLAPGAAYHRLAVHPRQRWWMPVLATLALVVLAVITITQPPPRRLATDPETVLLTAVFATEQRTARTAQCGEAADRARSHSASSSAGSGLTGT